MNGRFLGALVLAAAAWAAPAAALDPHKLLTQYGHDVWQIEDGLPQNTIRAIRQTRDGYLWLATEEGLVRFDGVRFTVFDPVNTPEMPVSFVNTIFEDDAGVLWIGTGGGGLVQLQDGRFTAYGLADRPSLPVSAVAQGQGTDLWLGASGTGLLEMKDGTLRRWAGNAELPRSGRGYVLHRDRQGTLWVGAKDGGLVALRDGRLRRYTLKDGLADDHVWSLAEAGGGGLWIGTDRGFSRLAGDGTIANHVLGESIRALLEDRHGTLWIGSHDGGLRRLRDGQMLQFGKAEGLSSASVWSLFEDREGSLWVGTSGGGLNRLRDGALTALGTEEGLPADHVAAVHGAADGTVWASTRGGALTRVDGAKVSPVITTAGPAQGTIVSFANDRDGVVWMGTAGAGLRRWKDGRSTAYTTAQGLPHESVFALLAGREGGLWIGHRGGGLSRLQDGTFVHYGPEQGLDSSYVWSLVEGPDGTLWVGTSKGVYALAAGAIRPVIPGVVAHAVHVDADGVVWAGTAADGLHRYKDGRASAITRRQGLFDNVVHAIAEDGQGRLWMSCNKGIFSVSKQQLHDAAEGRIARVVSTSYDRWDGMKSSECNQYRPWKDAEGRLWFPTIRGVVAVDPAHLKKNTVPPPVVIEEVVANGRALSPASGAVLEVPPGEGRLQVQYTALSLVAPKRVRFAYRLEGLDERWTEEVTTRQAQYVNLPPGHYTFRVKASNNDGVWNESGASVRVHLQPHFHQTAWFYLLCAAGVAAAGWQGHRIRLRRLLEVERIRTRIAADLHDDVGSGLSQIAILTGVARAQMAGNGGAAPESLDQIAGTAEELVDSMGDIVWATNPGKDRMGDLLHRMRRFAGEVFAARGIGHTFRAEGIDDTRRVDPDFRRHVYLLLKESVTNAARHSGCKQVDVVVEVAQGRLRLQVKDDGKGFDTTERADGHGLGTMGRRAEELGGRLTIASRPGEGTTVRAEVPLKRGRPGGAPLAAEG
jgi:ligand-binding sensor domain-containing protein/signal transduction histidine kinase